MKRVLVVGAGPTGLTAALELARQGLIPDVIEKRLEGASFSRAVGLLPSSMRIFERIGIAAAVRAEAMEYGSAAMYANDELTARVALQAGSDKNSLLLGLAQDRTEAILTSALQMAGGRVQHGVKLVSLGIENSHAVATVCSGTGRRQVLHYDLVVGADGVHSTVRRSLGLEFEGYELPEDWSIADVDVEDWDAKTFSLFRLSGGRIAVVAPLEANRVRVISNTANALQAVPVPIKVLRTRREGTFKISIRQVKQYNYGPVYLAGDAAHCHSPAGGRGMNLGIADGVDLAERIIRGNLEGYGEARHAAGHKTIVFSERGRRIMTSRNPLVRAGVSIVFKLLAQNRSLRERVIDNLLRMS